MAGKVAEICTEKINPIIEKMGYSVVEVEYAKKNDGMNLSFFIDSPNGITIEDCEKVHKEIDIILDEINPTEDKPYILNVCSPGLDRPIKNHNDFLRNQQKEVDVKLFKQHNGKKVFTGKLTAYTSDGIELSHNGEIIKFLHNQIAIISPVIKF